MSSAEDILGIIHQVIVERDDAKKAFEAALYKIEALEEEIGGMRTSARLHSLFDDLGPASSNTAWKSSSESIRRVSTVPSNGEMNVGKSPPSMPSSSSSGTSCRNEDMRQFMRCSRCLHKGHIDSECRFRVQCNKCKLYGHTDTNCRVALHIRCARCKAFGHSEERCFRT